MDSSIVPVVVGALIGAGATALGTWWVSVRLARQDANMRLLAALSVVHAEINENRRRAGDAETGGGELTLGDWATHKPTLALLRLRNLPLWNRLVVTYGGIYEHRKGRADMLKPGELATTAKEIELEENRLLAEINRFSRLPGARGRVPPTDPDLGLTPDSRE